MLPYKNRQLAEARKNECAYGKALEVLFSENFVLYYTTDCLSEASCLLYNMSSTKIIRELGLLMPWSRSMSSFWLLQVAVPLPNTNFIELLSLYKCRNM